MLFALSAMLALAAPAAPSIARVQDPGQDSIPIDWNAVCRRWYGDAAQAEQIGDNMYCRIDRGYPTFEKQRLEIPRYALDDECSLQKGPRYTGQPNPVDFPHALCVLRR
ncbi:hypothetical protein HZ989_06780 [Brevundimonas sp. AJA228-03]|uniref:hypothetical protein n=1 Tax=Brevundimonas sp. AJA228-03 TaxID=2752515 RepID=UPI001AE09D41|nr:hypothetical protein [Brevundimonas sp. AJA228-03]QTN20743.1 hypothetical protein HZ989_06780 [Brevundimonas sp. AJA228-03]